MDKDETKKFNEFVKVRKQFYEINKYVLDKIFSYDISKKDRKKYLDVIVNNTEDFWMINMEIVRRQSNGMIDQLLVKSILSDLFIWEESIKNS